MSEQIEYDRAHYFKAYASLIDRAIEDVRMLPEVRRAMEQTRLPEGTGTSPGIKFLSEKLGGANGR